jgi:hypothetical protein
MPGPILDAHFLEIAEIVQKFRMVQLPVTTEIFHAGTGKIGTVGTTLYVRFVFGA